VCFFIFIHIIIIIIMADWIQWFCSMEGHDFFCEVDRSFIGTADSRVVVVV
jgi:hypothetical protein